MSPAAGAATGDGTLKKDRPKQACVDVAIYTMYPARSVSGLPLAFVVGASHLRCSDAASTPRGNSTVMAASKAMPSMVATDHRYLRLQDAIVMSSSWGTRDLPGG